MDRIGICGHFGIGHDFFDGQTIKTRILAEELEKVFGKNEISLVDTYKWKINPTRLIFNCIKLAKKCEIIIMLPGQNGLKLFVPLFILLNRLFKIKIHYVVIGGWLPNIIENNSWLQKKLKKLDGIYVETNSMSVSMMKFGFKNVEIMPNFKFLDIISEEQIMYNKNEPYKLCTFSRVLKEKGIEDAINSVICVNSYFNRIVFTLDIYGQIDKNYADSFYNLRKGFPEYITYKGIINYNESTIVLKNYFALLFPTYYIGEGFAGTILDSFSAGVPVIATNWRYNSDIINDKIDGLLYDYKDKSMLESILKDIAFQPNTILKMKPNCIKRARQYTPEKVIGNFIKCLKEK